MLRILHCPTNIGGNAAGLARAERAIGLNSRSVSLFASPFGFTADEELAHPGFIRQEITRWRLLFRSLLSYDVIHFNFGQSILMPLAYPEPSAAFKHSFRRGLLHSYAKLIFMKDLPLLKSMGKTIVVTFQGDDVRQGDIAKRWPVHFVHDVEEGYYTAQTDVMKRQRVAAFARWADRLFCLNPDLLHLLPETAQFLPYASVDPEQLSPSRPPNDGPLVVMHAPSHRAVKGTEYILQAVSQLRADGIPIELRLIENLPNSEARRQLATADLVIDQLLAGWYGSLAVECMAMAKPIICYLRPEDMAHIPPAMRSEIPIISATPGDLTMILRQLATAGRSRLAEIGEQSRSFCLNWHAPRMVARYLDGEYRAARNGIAAVPFHMSAGA